MFTEKKFYDMTGKLCITELEQVRFYRMEGVTMIEAPHEIADKIMGPLEQAYLLQKEMQDLYAPSLSKLEKKYGGK